MPNIYKRKSNKGSWAEENLKKAVEAVQNDSLTIRAAGRKFSIPESTLRNRLKKKDFVKRTLGPDSQLGVEAEKILAVHIRKLQADGFAPTERDVRMLAYNLVETLGKTHTFNKEKGLAGKAWFSLFMRRHPELSVRKAQGISRAGTEGMNREEDHAFLLDCDPDVNQTIPETVELPLESTDPQSISTTLAQGSLASQPSTSGECNLTFTNSPTEVPEKLSPIPSSFVPSKAKRKQSAKNVTDAQNMNEKGLKKEAVEVHKCHTKKRLNFQRSSPSTTSGNCKMELLSDHDNEDECTECLELYQETTLKSDWIQCITCRRRLHESCTIYNNMCIDCGRQELQSRKKKTSKLGE